MSAAANLRRRCELLDMYRTAWMKAQTDSELTLDERDVHRQAYQEAREKVGQAIQRIRESQVLVLSSIAETREFLSVWDDLKNNRGILRTVQIANVNTRDRRTIERRLVERRFIVRDVCFDLPAN
ncbi:hypothetical protein ACJRO7_001846 [Eucalyptus globulus]|uniref:Uncharacterized protein n=1 Tax=Eucalyptus globulus TaxID=34317 RepID=A0ABD3LXW2_EUCGL